MSKFRFLKKHWWAILFGILLIAFTSYVLLDTFVIARVYTAADDSDSLEVAYSSYEDWLARSGQASASDATAADSSSGSETAAEAETTGDPETTTVSETATVSETTSVPETTTNPETTTVPETTTIPETTTSPAVITDNSYTDDNISITITQYREYETEIYVADILLSSPEYLKTALAQGTYGKNVKETTSDIAAEVGAILAIDGDYYGAREGGYVIRNGVLYRSTMNTSTTEALVIGWDGSFSIVKEGEVSASDLLSAGAAQVLSFGPSLLIDSAITVTEDSEVAKHLVSNPRTAIGIIGSCHYVFVVSDGRTEESAGLSLLQLAQFMQDLGVTIGYNLDGGGSATMVFNGSVVNNPTSDGVTFRERRVTDIVYIGY